MGTSARTDWTGVKTAPTPQHISYRLEPSARVRAHDSVEALRLQKWRVVGDGRTWKEQIRAFVTGSVDFPSLSNETSSFSEQGAQNTDVSATLPSREFHPSRSPPPTVEEEVLLEDRGQSSSITYSMVEGQTMSAQSPPPAGVATPSSGSEFTNADGYISGQEEQSESEKEELEQDSVELTVKEAHCFKIFRPDDEETREPVPILDLDFDCENSEPGKSRLHIVGYCASDSSGLFMRTIDSWSMKQDKEQKLELFVRDIMGVWFKLRSPDKGYEVSVRGACLIAKFLDLAMISKESNPMKCLEKLERIWSRDEIKTVLLKYQASVVEKNVQSTQGPKFAWITQIVKNMESLLKGKSKEILGEWKPAASVKRSSMDDEIRGGQTSENKRRRIKEVDPECFIEEEAQKERKNTASIAPASNKRRRVVESDSDDQSSAEDHVPLARRKFESSGRSQTNKLLPRDELVKTMVESNRPDADFESRKHDQDSGVSAGLLLSPAFNTNNVSSRFDELGTDYEGKQEYQDIADAYGGQSDGLGEIVDDDDEELGDSAFCAICDDGGDLLLCDGPCMRSFHASKESAARSESKCRSLGYDVNIVRGMGSWKCRNCEHGQHQCFICGQLGRSTGEDKEVFVCDVALCGRFYHPGCLAKWKMNEKFNSITDEAAFIQGVKDGVQEFCCPAHKCRRCGEGEQEGGTDNSMKLAKCRRCPKAYHKLCLPKSISFDKEPIRAWEIGDEDDPVKRLVIYCVAHEIVEHLLTPRRNHLKWPEESSSPENVSRKDSLKRMRHLAQVTLKQQKHPKKIQTRRIPVQEKDDKVIHGSSWKATKVPYKDHNLGERHALVKPDTDLQRFITGGKDRPKRDALVLATIPLAAPPKHVNALKKIDVPKKNVMKKNDLQKKNVIVSPAAKSSPTSTEGREKRVVEIMQRASQKISLETIKQKLAQPSCYGENRKKNFLHHGELQSMINAIKKAADKVKNGGSLEDAKRLCPKDYFLRFLKNEDMLKVHLAPILHGMRYTSFGRHFTCVDKLKEIVNRIHPYIDSGDMIVDFCCGANDFSIVLRDKLLSTGKTCQFMNFDIHPPKNGFCFTKGDWLVNQGHGFLEGKKLIMGLNPPFGVRAALANRFIIHAMKFKPKLLVLIVPPETMSYSADYKDFGYDLVWEDKELLKGHAFYLPGSVDDNDGQNKTQWNVIPPPLYLWSSRDMIQKHRDIAVQCKHVDSLEASSVIIPTGQTPPAVDALVIPTRLTPTQTSPVDALVVPSRRNPTPPPSSREVSMLSIPSDKLIDSQLTPAENDTSSSRLQHSSETSSVAEGLSHSSLDGSGQIALRTGPGHGSVGHTPAPGAGRLQNREVIPVTHNAAPVAPSNQPGPSHTKFHGNLMGFRSELSSKHGKHNLNQSASQFFSKHENRKPNQLGSESLRKSGNSNLKQSSPRQNQAQWGPEERPHTNFRHDVDAIHRQHFDPYMSHRQPVLEPRPPLNLHGGQQPWLGGVAGPNLPFNHQFPPHIPNQGLPMWPPPPLPPPFVHGFLPGYPLPPAGDPYFRGPPGQLERRPGRHRQGAFPDSGGWLE